MTPRELMALPPRRAVVARFLQGRARHGPRWQGDHPLLEAYVELVDLAVYVDVAEAIGELPLGGGPSLRASCWPLFDVLREAVVTLEQLRPSGLRVVPSMDALAPLAADRWNRPPAHFPTVSGRRPPNGGSR